MVVPVASTVPSTSILSPDTALVLGETPGAGVTVPLSASVLLIGVVSCRPPARRCMRRNAVVFSHFVSGVVLTVTVVPLFERTVS